MTGGELQLKRDRTGWIVSGLGVAVTGLGRMVGGRIGAGIAGFGLAHIVLGFLDKFRPSVRS